MRHRFAPLALGLMLGSWALPGAAQTSAAPAGTATPTTDSKKDLGEPARVRAKFGEGIGVSTADGEFGLALKARAQVRTTVTVPNEEPDDTTANFQIRRLRLSLDGHAFGDLVSFKVQLAFAPLDLDPVAPAPVRDAYLSFEPHRDFALRAGQMKVPFGRQRVVSSGSLAMVDRSIVTAELNLDRDVGIQAYSEDLFGWDGLLGYHVGVFGGDGRNRVSESYGLLYVGRLELRPLFTGPVDLAETDLGRSRKPRLELGVSGAFNHDTDRQRSTIGDLFETGAWADYLHLGVDWVLKVRGLALSAELFHREALTTTNEATVDDEVVVDTARGAYGGFLQGSYLFDDHAEVSARYGTLHPLHGDAGGAKREREVGAAFSYYFAGHSLKLQTDYFYIFDDLESGKHQARLQLQIAP